MLSSATSASQRSSSSGKPWHPTEQTVASPSTVTKKTTSTTTVLHTTFHSGTSATITSEVVVSTTPAANSPSVDSNSISDTRIFQEPTSSSIIGTTLISSSLPIETTELPSVTFLEPTPTTSGMILSTFVIASTDSLGVHTFTKVATISHFQPSGPSSTPDNDLNLSHHSSSPNISKIVLIVLVIIGTCVLALLFIWWYRGRRRRGARDSHIDPFSGGRENSAGRQRFGRASNELPYFRIGSNSNNHGRGTTLTPFLEQTSTDVLVIGNPGLPSPHVRFEKLLGESEKKSEDGTKRRTRGGTTQRDRPPTYHTNTTGLATIATSLPLYSAIDPSPISERSDTSTTPTASTMPTSPLAARRSQPARLSPRTPLGRKF